MSDSGSERGRQIWKTLQCALLLLWSLGMFYYYYAKNGFFGLLGQLLGFGS